ncbi:MAG: hypothetical protein KDD04_01905 [Sinomicrobium sp.]|nr:hypothetical protein [Sinomicrobium sp.]
MNSKTKNIIAVSGFCIALFLCYRFAVSNTLNYRSTYRSLKKEVTLFRDIPEQLAVLTRKEAYYDSLQHSFRIAETSFQNNLLRAVNSAAGTYGFKVIDFNEPHRFKADNLQKNSYSLTVEGSFMSLLKLLHHLEQETKFGEIIHCSLEKKKDYKTRQARLQAQIIIQHME